MWQLKGPIYHVIFFGRCHMWKRFCNCIWTQNPRATRNIQVEEMSNETQSIQCKYDISSVDWAAVIIDEKSAFFTVGKNEYFDCDKNHTRLQGNSIKTAGTAQIGLQRNFGHALTEDGIYIGLVSRVFSLKEKVDYKYLWPFLLRSVESWLGMITLFDGS